MSQLRAEVARLKREKEEVSLQTPRLSLRSFLIVKEMLQDNSQNISLLQ